MPGAFIWVQKRLPVSLFTFPSLMTCLGQKFSMFVLSHFFSAFFNNTTQFITSFASNVFIQPDLESNRFQTTPEAGKLQRTFAGSPQAHSMMVLNHL